MQRRRKLLLIPFVVVLLAAAMFGMYRVGAQQAKVTKYPKTVQAQDQDKQEPSKRGEQQPKVAEKVQEKQVQPQSQPPPVRPNPDQQRIRQDKIEPGATVTPQQGEAAPQPEQKPAPTPEEPQKQLTWDDINWYVGGSKGILIDYHRLGPKTSEDDWEIKTFKPTKEAGYPDSLLGSSPTVLKQFKKSGSVFGYEDQRGIVAIRVMGYVTTGMYTAPYPKLTAEIPYGTFGLRIEAADAPSGPWKKVAESTIRSASIPGMASFLFPDLQGKNKVYFRFVPVNWPEYVGVDSFWVDTGYVMR
ncbi:MAG: hypothetical protein ACUVSK_11865 [Desulfotomaculales bacterium]